MLLAASQQQRESVIEAQHVMPEQIAPDDLIAAPKDVPEALHRVIERLGVGKIDFLVLQLAAI